MRTWTPFRCFCVSRPYFIHVVKIRQAASRAGNFSSIFLVLALRTLMSQCLACSLSSMRGAESRPSCCARMWRRSVRILSVFDIQQNNISPHSLSSHLPYAPPSLWTSRLFAKGSWCLTANKPTAVTTLLLSGLVNVRIALRAKLGSATVRPPFPWTCLGGIAVNVVSRGLRYLLVASDCWNRIARTY